MYNLQIIEREGQRVLTTQQLAEGYGASENNIKNNFANNKVRFIEGKHYYFVQGEQLKEFKNQVNDIDLVPKHTASLYLWTEKGALRHAKILDTDQAWDVYEQLEDTYFRARKNQSLQLNLDSQVKAIDNVVSVIANKVMERVDERLEVYEQNYRPTHANKMDLNRYIKNMLGENRESGEVEKVKERVLLMMGGDSWQDIPLKKLIENMNLIDESIKSIMSFRAKKQLSMFEQGSIVKVTS